MDFHLPDDIEKLRIKTKQFVDAHIIPLESDKLSYDDIMMAIIQKLEI
mgnify:CR=1 FL=1